VCARKGLRLEVLQPREGGFFVRIWKGDRFVNHQTNQCTVNSYSAKEIAADKSYTYLILQRANIRVPRGDYYFRPGFFTDPDFSVGRGIAEAITEGVALGMGWAPDEARAYLSRGGGPREDLHFTTPLIVKPNSASGGKAVSRVDLSSELAPAIDRVFSLASEVEYIALVQEYIPGREYRLVLLDGELEVCYEKRQFSVRGDGARTLRTLILEKDAEFRARGERIEQVDLSDRSPALGKILKRENLDLDSRVEASREVVLNEVTSNLAAGAEAVDVTGMVPGEYVQMARVVAKEMQLRYLGIDFRCPDLSSPAREAVVLEVNGNPDLAHLYLQGDKERVVGIYEKLFSIMLE
jgi:glutathione synthase/RimK-type ligase-like ATP-grasp enzyme